MVPARGRIWLRAGFAVGAVFLLAQFAAIVPAARDWMNRFTWLYELRQDAFYLVAVALVAARAMLVRRDRGAWSLMAAGLGCYAVGTVCWVAVFVWQDPPPFPSFSDAMWLAYYPFAYAAVLRLLWVQRSRISMSTLLDGLIAAACAAAFASVLFLTGFTGLTGPATSVMVSLAYPIADIALSGLLLGVWALSGWRTERVWLLLLAGMGTNTAANGLHAFDTTHGSFVPGSWEDALWAVALAGVALAAWQYPERPERRAPARATVGVVLPAVLACASMGLLLYGSWHEYVLPHASSAFAAIAIMAAVARMVLTVHAVASLADARRQARTDDLTELPNRRLFQETLDRDLHQRDPQRPMAVAIIDLDRFKEINDSFGHHLGDQLLLLVAARLGEAFGGDGMLARLGGDEFGLLLPAADMDRALQVATGLLTALRHPFELEQVTLHIDASIGLAVFPDHGTDRTTLLRHADTAMYTAKSDHSGLAIASGAADDDTGRRRLTTLEELRTGLDNGELVLHYQPQLDLVSGAVSGVEALVRWDHPTRGLVYPDGFLALAENAGLIGRLTTQVLEMALQQCRDWRAAGLDLTVAVNLSASNLHDPGLPGHVAAALARYGVPPAALHLEVTEEVLMRDAARATETLDQLRAMGIRLAVDDYGTGYSSLAYLHALPVDDLKLDRAFVGHCDTDPRSAAIVKSTVELAHNLGMRLVAEGVENEAVLERLRRWDCDLVQGYHLSRPQAPDRLTPWLLERQAVLLAVSQGGRG
ncbi:putative signaling protein [Actinoplanes sp. SE50]|uniref:putative bifunctional diguanylate cyclase/phosphodiesterase n=1 Tax=unclassified Actinoplanes TaxID=2626549 RepID=UPI00023EC7A1|nr:MULTISPECIES: EAL domain-containing protein [unclassified Actinoplanes]AEV84199.1 putative signaling protein [Actinoplanes sp. SE50/110]ATO82591.1 putative signaling protein [Actinoplanes sp. SE50]SLL99998.1 putative signaling protein [Actinoplanes sp. SE50/110]